MRPEDTQALRTAKRILENTSLAARITTALGKPLEKGLAVLPGKWSKAVNDTTRKALVIALESALVTLDRRKQATSRNWLHKVLVTASGAGGGALGLPALAVELPVSTSIMLRSIADVARSEGEELSSPDAKLACLEVFALGARSAGAAAAESGYFAVRAALAKAMSEAAEFIAERGLVKEGAPAIVRLISKIAARFSVAITEKAAAQAIPAIGAAGGAIVNLLFIDHFQDMARAHFTIRRLEREYGPDTVKTEYLRLS